MSDKEKNDIAYHTKHLTILIKEKDGKVTLQATSNSGHYSEAQLQDILEGILQQLEEMVKNGFRSDMPVVPRRS